MHINDFNLNIDKCINAIGIDNAIGCCLVINAYITYEVDEFEEPNRTCLCSFYKYFRPNHREIIEYKHSFCFWLKESKENYNSNKTIDERVSTLELFRQICIDTEEYKQF